MVNIKFEGNISNNLKQKVETGQEHIRQLERTNRNHFDEQIMQPNYGLFGIYVFLSFSHAYSGKKLFSINQESIF